MRLLVALAIALLSPLVLVTPARAAGETCEGIPATLVGAPGSTVTGTDGPDVIVTNGALEVDAGAGDDLVCTTGSIPQPPGVDAVLVHAGSGDDLVDRRGDTNPGATGLIYPEPGQDTVYGSSAADEVFSQDGERDVIATGDGSDDYELGLGSRSPGGDPDVVDLGAGQDQVNVGPVLDSGTSVDGGAGEDRMSFRLGGRSPFVLDAGAGTLVRRERVLLSFEGFEKYDALALDLRTPWRFVGSAGPDAVLARPGGLRGVDLGPGDDTLALDTPPSLVGARFTLGGGLGRDLLTISGVHPEPVLLDLGSHQLDVGRGALTGPVAGFEDAVATGSRVDLVGSGRANTLTVVSCGDGSVRGLAGDDTLAVRKLTGHRSCQEPVVRSAYGGAGDDTLTGGPDRERLDGGRGHDTGDGGPGHDDCVSIEAATSCERLRAAVGG